MPLWLKGLSTRKRANRAALWGGIAFLIEASRLSIGIVMHLLIANTPLLATISWTFGAGVVPLIAAVAGIRLIQGAGSIVGSIALFIVAFDVIFARSAISSTYVVSAVAGNVALFILMINGVRGALALQQVDYEKDVSDVFS